MKKQKKKLIITIIAIVIILLFVIISLVRCSKQSANDNTSTDTGVLAEPLDEHDLSTSISVSGTVESQEKSSVTSDLTYKISQLNVEVGDYVNAGDVLCVFDSDELEAQIKTLEDQINNSNSLDSKQKNINNRTLNEARSEKQVQLQSAQNMINNAQNDYDRAVSNKSQLEEAYNNCQNQISQVSNTLNNTLANEGPSENYLSLQEQLSELTITSGNILSQIQESENVIASCRQALDEANSNYQSVEKSANQQIQSAQDAIDTQNLSSNNDETKKELDALKRKLDKITVKADHSGIITSLNVSNGSLHAGGELMTIQNTNALKLTVSIKESDILNIKQGMKVIVTSNADEKIEVEGTVTKVVDFVSSTTTNEDGTTTSGYSADITLPENCGMLLGMGAKAKILISEESKSLAVSYDSIFSENDKSYVYKAVPSDGGKYKIEKVEVKTGTDSTYYTGITSDNLEKGDLIVSYPDTVSEDSLVDIDETYISQEDGE